MTDTAAVADGDVVAGDAEDELLARSLTAAEKDNHTFDIFSDVHRPSCRRRSSFGGRNPSTSAVEKEKEENEKDFQNNLELVSARFSSPCRPRHPPQRSPTRPRLNRA